VVVHIAKYVVFCHKINTELNSLNVFGCSKGLKSSKFVIFQGSLYLFSCFYFDILSDARAVDDIYSTIYGHFGGVL
jgi:hypothetical protein